MEYLNPTQLKTSVQKFFDKGGNIIDISIDNMNDNFCIDNYKPENTLRSTEFRKEFNSLCKGKTEAKNMEEKPKIDSKKIYLCREGQIRDIPQILEPLFDKPKKYYIYGTSGKFSFYHAILNIVDSEFILKGDIQKEKMIDECRNELVYNLDENYKKFNYKAKRFKKLAIKENLLNSKVFLPQVNTYIVDYYNLCLLIIDTETYLYSLANDYDKDKEFIVMIRKNNYYQPILGVDGKNKFNSDIVDKISKILKPEFEIDFSNKKEIEESNSALESGKLEKMWKYKLVDLQIIAEKMNIDIKIGKKNKKKEDLYEEIKSSM